MSDFFIADLHLGEGRIAKARGFGSPGDMDALIAKHWAERIGPSDGVWVLGDVGRVGGLDQLAGLPGEKHLIAGNCDDLARIIGRGVFAWVGVSKRLGPLLLSHMPVHPSLLKGGLINVHGHLHSRRLGDPRYRCVSAEQVGYAPVPLETG
jgi:calcineurin-like phosphoesterase family protein